MGKKAKMPKAPDPAAVSAAQTASNAATARLEAELNRTNQVGPYGSSTWTKNGDTWTQTQSLDPRLQGAVNNQMDLQGKLSGMANQYSDRVGQALNQPFNYDGLPQLQTDYSADRQRVEQALIDRNKGYMDSRFKQDEDALRQNLSDRGIGMGNPQYQKQLDDFRNNRNSAYSDLQSKAILEGGNEQSRLYGINSSARQQGIQERLLQRTQPLSELQALLGGAGTPQVPQFAQAPGTNVQGTDISGNIYNSYNAKLQAAKEKNANNPWNKALGTIGGLGGMVLGGYTGGLFK